MTDGGNCPCETRGRFSSSSQLVWVKPLTQGAGDSVVREQVQQGVCREDKLAEGLESKTSQEQCL